MSRAIQIKQLSQKATCEHLSRLISQWPKDEVRPEPVSAQAYLQRIKTLEENKTTPSAGFPPQSINALYSLLENRYQHKYPLPESLRHPRSQPSHYDDLMEEFRAAPTRDWWGRVVQRMKGMLRLR